MTDRTSITPSPFFRRLAAYGIDILLIYVYVFLLFGISMAVNFVFPFHHLMSESYLLRHSTGFLTLSLPVLIWFWKWESGTHQATPGKRVMRIRLEGTRGHALDPKQVLVRNLLKFLPWEWAHTFLHIHPDFLLGGDAPTLAVWLGMFAPQIVVLGYVMTVILRKDGRSPYDMFSSTQIVRVGMGAKGGISAAAAVLLVLVLGVQVSEAQPRPKEVVARITYDRQIVKAGSIDLQHVFGIEGHVVLNRFVIGGSGQVHVTAKNAMGRFQSGASSIHAGIVLLGGTSWKMYPTTGVGIRGVRWTPFGDEARARLDVTGLAALNLDKSVPGFRKNGSARVGLRLGWQPTILQGSWDKPASALKISASSWFVGMNVGFGVGSAAR